MKIYTTYFANLKNVPETITPIAICGGVPKGWIGLRYSPLAPKYSWWKEWKDGGLDESWYIEKYQETVLDQLNPKSVIKELGLMSEGKDVALVCYEKPETFCHRHLVADWLNKAGFSVEEL